MKRISELARTKKMLADTEKVLASWKEKCGNAELKLLLLQNFWESPALVIAPEDMEKFTQETQEYFKWIKEMGIPVRSPLAKAAWDAGIQYERCRPETIPCKFEPCNTARWFMLNGFRVVTYKTHIGYSDIVGMLTLAGPTPNGWEIRFDKPKSTGLVGGDIYPENDLIEVTPDLIINAKSF